MKPIIVPARDAVRAVRARPTNGASADGRNVNEPNEKTAHFDHVGYRLRCRRCGAVGSGSIWPQGHVWAHGRTDAAISASRPPAPSPGGGDFESGYGHDLARPHHLGPVQRTYPAVRGRGLRRDGRPMTDPLGVITEAQLQAEVIRQARSLGPRPEQTGLSL